MLFKLLSLVITTESQASGRKPVSGDAIEFSKVPSTFYMKHSFAQRTGELRSLGYLPAIRGLNNKQENHVSSHTFIQLIRIFINICNLQKVAKSIFFPIL